MFFDPAILATFIVDRQSGGGKLLRRVVAVHSDGTLSVSKTNGVLRRMVPLSNVTHIVTAPDVEEDEVDDVRYASGASHAGGASDIDPADYAETSGNHNRGDAAASSVPRRADPHREYLDALHATENQEAVAAQRARAKAPRGSARRLRGRSADGAIDAASDDPRAWVLLRVSNEHDLLFLHVPTARAGTGGSHDASIASLSAMGHDAHVAMSRMPPGVLFVDLLQRERAKLRAAPLRVATKANCTVLREAADVTLRDGFTKPRAFAVTDQILTPMTFDDLVLKVPAVGSDSGLGLTNATSLSIEPAFLTHLHRCIRVHPSAASQPPLVAIEAPEPFPSTQVSARFLAAFCRAYDEAMPHVVVLQTHLPRLVSFRASRRFWAFVQSSLRVSRPPQTVAAMLGTNHVVVHVDDDERAALSATTAEWNDVVIAWEADVRTRIDIGGGETGSAGKGATGTFGTPEG
eukprot:CAMPEP_0174869598 /NCGR_PEP_ID=MMETSP1114-20130205/68137_1 /TAXON_ID=312471 /ORGANISM="Neobodo designis, Strain CCAP 1951/1" /LENGTH=462 /DNA_ID=CAMNT_0016104849 /DNA_START=43 /DNA_END=1427 /DNA_ORIENTATION=+